MSLFETELEAKKRKQDENTVHRLTDMLVTDVDIVDRPANGRRFLLFKRGCGMADVSSVEITEKDGGELIAVSVSEPDVESGADSSEKNTEEVAKQEPEEDKEVVEEEVVEEENKAEDMEEDKEVVEEEVVEEEVVEEEKSVESNTLPGPVKAAILSSVGEATDRLMGVQTVLRSANVTVDKTSAPLPNKIYGELKAIGELLSGVSSQYASPTAKSESGAGEFVRDILKQAGVVMHGEVRDSVMASVGSGVEMLMALSTAVKAFEEVEAKSEGTMPTSITEAIKAVTDNLSKVIDEFPSPAAKSNEVLAKLEECFEGIRTVISDVLNSSGIIPEEKAKKPEMEEEEGEEEMKAEDGLAKSEGSERDVLTEMKKSIDALIASMATKDQNKASKVKKEIPSSNATDADAGADDKELKKSEKPVVWPQDIAESLNEGE